MIYLASHSPRRRQLLEQIGIAYQMVAVTVDETPYPQEFPANYVQRLALAKARAGYAMTQGTLPVLGADTAVVCEGQLFGKPTDNQAAERMLTHLAGRCHQVLSAVALVTATGEQVLLNTSTVSFATLTPAEIRAYIATGEPHDKAGSYAIQGFAAAFIERIEGSYSGIMGLPLYETVKLLKTIDITLSEP